MEDLNNRVLSLGPVGAVRIVARSPLPTKFGTFDFSVFRYESVSRSDVGLSSDHIVLSMGELEGVTGVLVRVHSECLTSEVFGSLKCDCRKQLVTAQREIAAIGRGVVVYLRQEGRGIGLVDKIRAYDLQSRGRDTVDANRLLGLPDDIRDYAPAAAVLRHLGVNSIKLMTNNPLKVEALRARGVEVERRALVCSANPWSASYLEAKRTRMGHILPRREDCEVEDEQI